MGEVTLENFSSMHAVYGSVLEIVSPGDSLYSCLSDPRIPSGIYHVAAEAEASDHRHDSDHAADVDEFSGPHLRVADDSGK